MARLVRDTARNGHVPAGWELTESWKNACAKCGQAIELLVGEHFVGESALLRPCGADTAKPDRSDEMTTEQRARYCGFLDKNGRPDVEAFARAVGTNELTRSTARIVLG